MEKNLARHMVRNVTTYRMFVSYTITFIIPLIVMGILSYFWMGGIISEQNEQVYIGNLRNVKIELDNKISEMDEFSTTIAGTPWMQKLIFMPGPDIDEERMDPWTLKDHLNELANYKAMNGFIENFAIYMYNVDLVAYPNGIDQFDWFFTHKYAFDGKNPEYWRNIIKKLNADNASAFLKSTQVSKYYSKDNLFVYVKTLPMKVGEPCATIFFTIREESINILLKDATKSANSSVYILDSDNSIIAGVNSDDEKKRVVEELMNRPGKAIPKSIHDKNGNDYFVYSVIPTEGSAGWKYIALFPREDILSKVTFIKNITLFISITLLLMGILISYVISCRNYKPVGQLVNLLFDGLNLPKEKSRDDYALIETGIRSLKEKEAETNENIGKYKTALLKDLMEKLLNGQNRDMGKNYKKELAANGFEKMLYSVFIIKTENEMNWQEEKIVLENYTMYLINREKQLIVIVNMDVPSCISEAAEYFRNKFADSKVTTGIGNGYEVEYTYRSYNEACVALDYEMLKGTGSIIRYDDIKVSTDKKYHYPAFFNKQLVDGIENMNYCLLRDYFDKSLKSYITQSNISLSIERLVFYKRVQLELEKLPEPIFAGIVNSFEKQFLLADTIEDIQLCIENMYKEIFKTSIKQKETYSNELIKRILTFIDDNYSDSSLSLTVLADHFNINMSKLSLFIKDSTGENFIDYLLKRRVRIAKELLAQEGLTVEEIGIQVGFDNVQTFRRAFKKYENITPGQFREEST